MVMKHDQKADQRQTAQHTGPSEQHALRLRFVDLAGGRNEVQIEHRGQVYRLRVTRHGKLILNK
jgi:hemin uptake protein HemP